MSNKRATPCLKVRKILHRLHDFDFSLDAHFVQDLGLLACGQGLAEQRGQYMTISNNGVDSVIRTRLNSAKANLDFSVI